MAKQRPGGYLEGTINGINYYQRKGRFLARQKPGVTTQRWQTDGTFERTRKAATDFGLAVRHAVGLRQALGWMLRGVCTLRSLGVLHARMFRCVRSDTMHVPGERELNFATLFDFLVGHEFNDRLELASTFLGTWETEWLASTRVFKIVVGGFDSGLDLVAPAGATHFTLCAGAAWWTGAVYQWSAVVVESAMLPIGVGIVEGLELVMQDVVAPADSKVVAVFGVRWFVGEEDGDRLVKGGAANVVRVVAVF
jgi:hypothetical protein